LNASDATSGALAALPALPRDDDGPVFAEPWQAQAFAMTLRLYEKGAFTWPEWAETLSREITKAQQAGDPDTGETYYLHWLAALEQIVADKGLTSLPDLVARRDAWARAALTTPHGDPIVLGRENA
jgi:nitrile hydratase accessory protein